uniref:Integrase core domain containing protein n=1 Tax=Solanum tuberosum TaxID=4113 RepID=M1BHZ6_SOLTU
MARPKVAGKDMSPRHVRARDFKRDEKIAELVIERKESKKASVSRRIPIDPTIHSWKRGLHITINSFWAAHELDKMIAAHIAVEVRANEHNATQNDNPGTIVEFQANASGNDAPTDGASV